MTLSTSQSFLLRVRVRRGKTRQRISDEMSLSKSTFPGRGNASVGRETLGNGTHAVLRQSA
jgi:hypothetical protein